MTYFRNLLASTRFVGTIMITIMVLVSFGLISWNEIQIASVEAALAAWMLLAQEVFKSDLDKLARAEAEAAMFSAQELF